MAAAVTSNVTVNQETVQTLNIRQEIAIAAPIEIAWESVLAQAGPENVLMDGTPYPFKLEEWPGGRWYRDLGKGVGHLWGHVQVIKPPKLLEICGPLMMSYPAVNFVQYRLTSEGTNTTRLQLTHRAMGLIEEAHRDGMPKGWPHWLERMKAMAEKRASK